MRKSIIGAAALLFSVFAGLTGCDNFLNGSDLKDKVTDQVAFQNQTDPLKVVSVFPAFSTAGVCCDTPVLITFNKPVNSETFNFTVKLNNFVNEFIYRKDFMELLDDSKTIKLTPAEIPSIESSYCDVEFIVLKDLEAADGTKFSLTDYSFRYRITKETDSVPPRIIDFNIAASKKDAVEGTNLLSAEKFSEWKLKDFQSNHLSEVWVYAKAFDEVSGCNFIRYVLNPVMTIDGTPYTGQPYETGFYADFEQLAGEAGYGECLFKVDFSVLEEILGKEFEGTSDLYKLDFYVFDSNLNAAETISRTIIYDKRPPENEKIIVSSNVNAFSDVDETSGKGKYTFYVNDELYDLWSNSDEGKTFVENLEFSVTDFNGNPIEIYSTEYLMTHVFVKPEYYYEIGDGRAVHNKGSGSVFNDMDYEYLAKEDYDNLGFNYDFYDYSVQSGALKITLSDISARDGALLVLKASDAVGNFVEIPLSVPGRAIYGGPTENSSYGPWSSYNAILFSSNCEADKDIFVSNLIRYSSTYIATGLEGGKFRLNDEVFGAEESFINFSGAQSSALRKLSDKSYVNLWGAFFKKEELVSVFSDDNQSPEIKNIDYVVDGLNSGTVTVNIEADKKNYPYAYINIYKHDGANKTYLTSTQNDSIKLKADGISKYSFDICWLELTEISKATLLTDVNKNPYKDGEALSFTDEEGNLIDNTPPEISWYQSGFWNDYHTGLFIKNTDDNPLTFSESDSSIQYDYWYHEIPAGYGCFEDFMTEQQIIEHCQDSGTFSVTYEIPGECLKVNLDAFEFGKRYELFAMTYDKSHNYTLTSKVINFETPQVKRVSDYGIFASRDKITVQYYEDFTVPGAANLLFDGIVTDVSVTSRLFFFDENEMSENNQSKTINDGNNTSFTVYFDKAVDQCVFGRVEYVNSFSNVKLKTVNKRSYYPDYYRVSYKYLIGFNEQDYKNDWWITPDFFAGSGGNKFRLVTNQPVFIHTLYCDKDQGDDIQKWERFGTETARELYGHYSKDMVGTAEEKAEKEYVYTVSGVPAGKYYAVIAYCADGTEIISSVYKK